MHTHTPLQDQWLRLPWEQTNGEPERHASSYLAVSSAGHVHVEDDLSIILGTVGPRRAEGGVENDKSEASWCLFRMMTPFLMKIPIYMENICLIGWEVCDHTHQNCVQVKYLTTIKQKY